MPSTRKLVKLAGDNLEGGGQVVRLAVSLASLTSRPIQINAIRGKRPSGGGLKSQHLTAIVWLARACGADLEGAEKGSRTLVITPSRAQARTESWWTEKPLSGGRAIREVSIEQTSPGSIGLILQAVLPFLLFAGCSSSSGATPINLAMTGGTNVSFSPSYEYIVQVLLPTLHALGVPHINASLTKRGWSTGTQQIGSVTFTITPFTRGQSLQASHIVDRGDMETIHVSLIVPASALARASDEVLSSLATIWPDVPVKLVLEEDSRHPKRLYLLLVAETSNGWRLGRDWLYDEKITDGVAAVKKLVKRVVDELKDEIRSGSCVDEYMQDQLIVFQALMSGKSTINGGHEKSATTEGKVRGASTSRARSPSLHTRTAQWVAAEILGTDFDDDGNCNGIGLVVGEDFGARAEQTLPDSLESLSISE